MFEAVAVNQSQFENHVDKTFKEMSSILKEKNRMYGGASMDTGLGGSFIRLHDKISRYKKLVNLRLSGEEESFESIEDTLRDIIGYATIGLAILEAQEPTKGSVPHGNPGNDTRQWNPEQDMDE